MPSATTHYPIALSGYRWRMRYNYAYTWDAQGTMYEYAQNSTTTVGTPAAFYFDPCLTMTDDATGIENYKFTYIYDSTAIGTDYQMTVYIYKINKTH